MSLKDQLIEKLNDRTAVIGIIGLGYVGLPLAIRYAQCGYTVLGFDIDPVKGEKIAAGKTYFKHIPDEQVFECVGCLGVIMQIVDPIHAWSSIGFVYCVDVALTL